MSTKQIAGARTADGPVAKRAAPKHAQAASLKNVLLGQALGMRLAVALLAATTIVACTSSTRTTETTGEYVDSAAITTKVKAALLGDSGLKSFEIGVETFKDVVQLSGFVDSPQAKAHAGKLAAGVPGVRSVRNDLVVK